MSLPVLFREDKPLFVQTIALAVFAAALPFSVSVIQGGALLFIAASLYLARREGELKQAGTELASDPLLWPWLAYLAAGALAAAFGLFPGRSFGALNSDLLTAVVFYGLALFLRKGNRDLALNAYLVMICAAAVMGIYQTAHGMASGFDVRARATSHPVRFGEIMVIGMALALSLASFQENLSARARKLLWAVIILTFSAIVLSQTRGAYLGMTLVFVSLLAARPRAIRAMLPLIGAALLLGAALAALNPYVRYKAGSIFGGASSAINSEAPAKDIAINARLVLWRAGFKIIKDHPVLGVGPANVRKVFQDYCPPPYPENKIWGSLHNLYIHQTAERGFVGLAALLALFGGMLLLAWRNFRAAPSAHTLWALIIMPSWFVMNITEITFQHVHTSYAVLLALAVSIAAARGR